MKDGVATLIWNVRPSPHYNLSENWSWANVANICNTIWKPPNWRLLQICDCYPVAQKTLACTIFWVKSHQFWNFRWSGFVVCVFCFLFCFNLGGCKIEWNCNFSPCSLVEILQYILHSTDYSFNIVLEPDPAICCLWPDPFTCARPHWNQWSTTV